MANILDYIGEQISKLNTTIDDNSLLKDEGMFIIAKYVAKNPDFIYGNESPYLKGRDGRINGTFGVNSIYWKELKRKADSQGKDKLEYFRDRILTPKGKLDTDVKKFIERLYRKPYSFYSKLVDALTNLINFQVMNVAFQSQSVYMFDKIYTNINFSSLPNGVVSSFSNPDYRFLNDSSALDVDIMGLLMYKLCPQNLNLEQLPIERTSKFFDAVANKDLNSVKINYKFNKAEGYIINDRTSVLLPEDYICSPLSISTSVDNSYFNGGYSLNYINSNATKYEFKPVSDLSKCSQGDLQKISDKAEFVKNLDTNNDYVRVSGIRGKDILKNVEPFNILSRNFYDTNFSENPALKQSSKGSKAISIKLFFDKINEVFINIRSNDLYFALTCATYMDLDSDTIDIYFNPKSDEAYFVNSNKEQYGYAKGVSSGRLSNCEHIVYAELYKPSLSLQQKSKLFDEQNIREIVLSDDIIEESEALQDALIRQSKLVDIKESPLFYKLLIDNIASFIFTYADQVSVNGQLQWKTKKNPKWSLDSSEGTYFKDKVGKGRWSNPDYFYIYDIRETFWMNNQNMNIEEVLAYFVTKGGSSKDNSSYFRKLSQRILGVDYFIFSDKLLPILIEKGLICIERLSFEKDSGQIVEQKYTYSYEYASGDVYKKLNYLNRELEDNIILYYGESKGLEIVDNQNALLNNNKPDRLTFGDKNPEKNLIVNIHNPIFFTNDEGFVGRIGKDYSVFRDGKTRISTIEVEAESLYKPIALGGMSKKQQYDDFKLNNPLNLTNNHLKKFYEFVVFGQGVDFISSPYLKQNEFYLVDGYIFPMSSGAFIKKHIMPKFEKIADEGDNIPCPLQFIPYLKRNNQKTFTLTNVYNPKSPYGFSNLTQQSRENLIKIGLVENKKKVAVEVNMPDPKNPKNTIKAKQLFTPITEAEGKRIFNVITDKYKKLESQIILEGNNLFTTFCKIQLTPDYRANIEEVWNKTYNNMAIADYTKFPIFCEHSRWFGSLPNPFLFNLRDAQVEGMKFAIANKNSGLLAHEVGFGKTTTSIAMMSHMMLTGESSRTIVFTPNQVYEKFADEIIGRDTTGTLGLLSNWQTLERNKRNNITDGVDIIKFGNASANILIGSDKEGGVKGLKKYTPSQLLIIAKWKGKSKPKGKDTRNEADKGVLEMAKDQLKNLPAGRPSFLPEDKRGLPNESRFSNSLRDSDFNDWFDNLSLNIGLKIPEIYDEGNEDTQEAIDNIVEKVNKSAQVIYDKVNSQYDRYQSGYRYQKQDFVGENKVKISEYPKSVQEFYKTNKNDLDKLFSGDYPQKGWITNLDEALKDGVVTKEQADRIKQSTQPWEGVLTQKGINDIKKTENLLSKNFFNPIDNKNTGTVTVLLKQIEGMLIDVLGQYRKEVMEPNKIILCSHQAIKRFRADDKANLKARKYVQNVEDVRYVNPSTNRFYDKLSNLPLSLKKLNIDGITVDEIHNFNNLISKPREHTLSRVDLTRGRRTNLDFTLLPTMRANATLNVLPDGDSVNSKKGIYVEEGTLYHNPNNYNIPTKTGIQESEYRLKYYSSGKGSLTTAPANLISLIFEIQAKEENKGVNNTILMSATPFTDNIFQMFSVFGMTNLDKMKESNIMSVWDFFVTFVKEEWRYNITHRQTFGLFPEIQSYYNSSAMSNFIKSMANFKVSDKIIEADRPLKYYIPQDGTGGNNQAGANTSSVQWAPQLQDVSSYVPLSPVQKEIISKIAQYVEGKIDIPFQYCPNYGDAIQVDKETGEVEFLNDEVKDYIKEVEDLLKKAKKEEEGSNEWEEYLRSARSLLVDLRTTYPEDKRIAKKQSLVDSALFDPETIKDMQENEELYDSNYEDMDLSANSKSEVRMARAIVGQGFGQMCVISPYLLKCDKSGDVPNDLLKNFPLDPNDISKSAKNFVENSPKIKYAIECALNTIKYDSKEGGVNDRQVGGQIMYINKGKSMKYGGHYYNLYELIKTYIVDQKITYYDNIKDKLVTLTKDNIGIITGGMSGTVKATDENGSILIDSTTGKDKTIGKREDIRDKFNDGRIKILLGSSAIKEGIDLNRRAHTLYVLDSDFSPSNAMQLEGRIWRQKNMWEFVRIVYVLGIDSIDAFVYSKLQTKIGEIKKMLEAGVYELNKTQYTIDAKERIRNIITDIDQLTDLAWQDKVDELNSKVAKYSDEKSKLQTIKDKYGEVKMLFDGYVTLMNKLYQLVKFEEKRKIALVEKDKLDVDILYNFKKDSRGRGRQWKENNKPVFVSIEEAMKVVEQQEKDGMIEFANPDLILTADSQMVDVNVVGDAVRKLIKNNRGTLENILEVSPTERNSRMRMVNKNSIIGEQIVKVITDNLSDENIRFSYDSISTQVNLFLTGTENERIMSNYFYLIENQIKNDVTQEGYNFNDIDILITKANNKVIEGQKELNSEKKWKIENRIKEEESQLLKAEQRGETLEELIGKFNNSMALLKIRVK